MYCAHDSTTGRAAPRVKPMMTAWAAFIADPRPVPMRTAPPRSQAPRLARRRARPRLRACLPGVRRPWPRSCRTPRDPSRHLALSCGFSPFDRAPPLEQRGVMAEPFGELGALGRGELHLGQHVLEQGREHLALALCEVHEPFGHA